MRYRERERKFTRKSGIVCASILWAILGVSFLVHADDSTLKKGKIYIPNPIYDFGDVAEGSKVSHDFIIKNSGTAPLIIQRIIPSCGCTNTKSATDSIAPDGQGAVHVEFDTSGFSGQKVKLIRVLTNDPDTSASTLTLKGRVENSVEIKPARIAFNTIRHADGALSASQDVTVRLKEGTNRKLGAVRALSKHVKVRELATSDSEKKFSVTILPSAPLGELRDRVIVNLEGRPLRTIAIPLFAIVEGAVTITPTSISFGLIEGSEALERSVKIENSGPKDLLIKHVKSDNPGVSWSVTDVRKGKRYVLKVRLDPKLLNGDESVKALITVETNSDPLLLTVYGTLPPKV